MVEYRVFVMNVHNFYGRRSTLSGAFRFFYEKRYFCCRDSSRCFEIIMWLTKICGPDHVTSPGRYRRIRVNLFCFQSLARYGYSEPFHSSNEKSRFSYYAVVWRKGFRRSKEIRYNSAPWLVTGSSQRSANYKAESRYIRNFHQFLNQSFSASLEFFSVSFLRNGSRKNSFAKVHYWNSPW